MNNNIALATGVFLGGMLRRLVSGELLAGFDVKAAFVSHQVAVERHVANENFAHGVLEGRSGEHADRPPTFYQSGPDHDALVSAASLARTPRGLEVLASARASVNAGCLALADVGFVSFDGLACRQEGQTI